VPRHAAAVAPFEHGAAGHLRAVVADDHHRAAAAGDPLLAPE
jgi:hypothetical protein